MSRIGIVAFAFGTPATIWPNRNIARIAECKAKELGAFIYTQQCVQIDPGLCPRYIADSNGKPPSTLRIARRAVVWALEMEISELWIVCAKPHRDRCLRDIEYAIAETGLCIHAFVCSEVCQSSDAQWFSPYSTQRRVRSPKIWQLREFFLQLLPMSAYKFLAR